MFRPLFLPCVLLTLCTCVLPVRAGQPFSFASTPGQLPKTAIPRHYQIQLTPDLTTMTTTGSEQVDVDVLSPTPTLVCNVRNMTVSAATVDGKTAAVQVDPKAETVAVTPGQPLGKGAHTLGLAFAGAIVLQPVGLYYVHYKDPDGTPRTMLGSQMEATDARRVFPCWDEPVYRATYQLSVTLPQDFTAVSNMPSESETPTGVGRKVVAFPPTPPMASYLVALVAGDVESVSGKTSDGIPVRVVTTRGKKATGEYALSVIEKLLPFYDNYFGVKFPLPKMDLIAVPGGFPGAMENWGAVVYSEGTVLWDPATSSQGQKEEVFHTIAHETAHQWFGDLVTMSWWDDLWLNEGFASWMDLKATDHFNPDWQVWLRAGDDKYRAMDLDARLSTHPIQQHLTDPAQIEQAFDDITYVKGANVIRMIETYLGPDDFQKGIRAYMAAHKYSSATTADLWDALGRASGKPVAQVAGSFTAQPGFPLVTAGVDCRNGQQTLSLSQTRFLLEGTPSTAQQWQVPVAFSGLKENVSLLTGQNLTLPAGPCGSPVIVNRGSVGYYRVKYRGALWDMVRKSAPGLPPIDQVEMLDDRWALVQANQSSATDALALIQALKDSTDLAVWQQIAGTLGTIDRLGIGRPNRAAFQAYAAGLLRPVMARVGYTPKPGEEETTSLLRSLLLEQLGWDNDAATVAWARARFADYLKDKSMLAPDLRRPVLETVGRCADQATYDQLHALAQKTTDFEEKRRYYTAMAAALDPKLAQQTLALALTDELPAPFNAFLIFRVAGDGEQPALAWDFVQKHQKEVDAQLSEQFRIEFVPDLLSAFSDASRAEELIAYGKAHLSPEAGPTVARAVSQIRTASALKQRALPEIDTWVRAHSFLLTPAKIR